MKSLSILLLLVLSPSFLLAQNSKYNLALGRTGLIKPSDKEALAFQQRQVRKVNPNALSIERLNSERKSKGLSQSNLRVANKELEIEIVPSGRATDGTKLIESSAEIPTSADNSLLPAFPVIGNQGEEGSCTTWATVYYQASHETCLVRGCDNKADATHTASPRWVYNMINDGEDTGSWWAPAYDLMIKNGFVSIDTLPYVAGDFRKWDLKSEDWVAALSNRAVSTETFGSPETEAGLNKIKQYLANGHVLTYATNVGSWVMGEIGTDPNQANNPFAGQPVLTYVNGEYGGHMMTIVGYDDSVWVDINANGTVDKGEKGAFKIANSWGTDWAVSGFAWISYDAIGATSHVVTADLQPNRKELFWYNTVYSLTAQKTYTPKLVARFTVNSLQRSQMTVNVGVGTNTELAPTQSFVSGAFNAQGGAYAFDGTTTAVDGNFAIDLTDIANANPEGNRFFLQIKDSESGDPVTLSNFNIINLQNHEEVSSSDPFPLDVDGGSAEFHLDYSHE
jgi:C1A family cysteine protease